MAKLLRLYQKAGRTSWDSLKRDLVVCPTAETMYMALRCCRYAEYEEWRRGRFRSAYPLSFSPEALLCEYTAFEDYTRDFYHQHIMMEKHFSFVEEDYEDAIVVSRRLFYTEWVQPRFPQIIHHLLAPLFLSFRHFQREQDLVLLRRVVLVCFPRDTYEWRRACMALYRQQSDLVEGADMEIFSRHLDTEHRLLTCLPWYEECFESIRVHVARKWSSPHPIPFRELLSHPLFFGVLRDGYKNFYKEWEAFLEEVWDADPWEAVDLLAAFIDSGGGSKKGQEACIARLVGKSVVFLGKTLSTAPLTSTALLARYGGPSFDAVLHSYGTRLWRHRCQYSSEDLDYEKKVVAGIMDMETTREAALSVNRLLCHMGMEMGRLFLPHVRVFLCPDNRFFSESLPSDDLGTALPPMLVEYKARFNEYYRSVFPHRKLAWIDWYSTVELTDGKDMTLPQYLVLERVAREPGLTLDRLQTVFGWHPFYLKGILGSLSRPPCLPLLYEKEGQYHLVREDQTRGPMTYTLPPFRDLPPPTTVRIASKDEERYVLEALLVRAVKKEGPMVSTLLLEKARERFPHTDPGFLHQVLERLVRNDYLTHEPDHTYHFVI